MKFTFTAVLVVLVSFSTILVESSSTKHKHGLAQENSETGVDIILSWIRDPQSDVNLANEYGKDMFKDFSIQDFAIKGCKLPCLYKAGILPYL